MSVGPGGLPAVPLEPLSPSDPVQLGPFRLLGRLGTGGMGVAFLASDAGARWVVVKTVWPHLAADRSFRARLSRELSVMDSVRNTSTAALVDADGDGEVPWFAMEFIPGVTLARRIEESGPLQGEELTSFAQGLLEAVGEIHAAGVTHRDIKPSNIMLSPDGPRLIDFGIADLAEGTQLTKTGAVLGSTGWLAPEQVRGDAATPATDVHAWALCVLFAATGIAPFGADTSAAAIYRVLESTPDVPDSLPEQLRGQLTAALAKDPTQRPTIEQLKRGHTAQSPASMPPVVTSPPPPPTPPAAPVIAPSAGGGQRKTWIIIAAVVALAAVTAGILVATQPSNAPVAVEEPAVVVNDESNVDPVESAAAPDEPAPAVTAVPPPPTDCTIGTLLPQTGTLAFLGRPATAGAELAVSDIQAAGGPIAKLIATDSGDTSSDLAQQSSDRLIAEGVSAIIGPMSSGVARTVIDQATSAGILMVSPSTTAPWLSDYEDNGLYFRTVPGDAVQGTALAQLMLSEGLDSVAVLYRDDAAAASYAPPIVDALEQAMVSGGGEIAIQISYDPDAGSFNAEARAVRAANPKAVVVVGFEESDRVVRALIDQGVGPQDVPLFLTDGNLSVFSYERLPRGVMRGTRAPLPGTPAPPDFQTRLTSVAPSLVDFSYAAETYDAVVLVALGMLASGSCLGSDIAPELAAVSGGGVECTSYAECADLLADGVDIDYQGVSGPIDFLENGDIGLVEFPVYEYTENDAFSFKEFVLVDLTRT